MEADKMFEELGYTQKEYYKQIVVYYDKKSQQRIQIDEFNKTFLKFSECDDAELLDINMQELQAINKKCKELGWIE